MLQLQRPREGLDVCLVVSSFISWWIVSKLRSTSLVFQKDELLVCSINRIIESRIDVFEVMMTQPGKNYESLLDNLKEENAMFFTRQQHSIDYYKELYNQKFVNILTDTQKYLRDRFNDLNTPPLCWL